MLVKMAMSLVNSQPFLALPANAFALRRRSNRNLLAALCLLLLTSISTGCASMSLPADGLFGKTAAEDIVSGSYGQCTVLMKPGFGKGTQSTLELTKESTVQSVLEQAGLVKKYRAMDIMIFRDVDGAFVPLKMAVDYDSRKRSVRPEQNYSVLPGDKILFSEKSNSTIGKALKNVAGIDM